APPVAASGSKAPAVKMTGDDPFAFAPAPAPAPPPSAAVPAEGTLTIAVEVTGKYGKGRNRDLCKSTLTAGGVQLTGDAPIKMLVTPDKPKRRRIARGEQVLFDEVRTVRAADAVCSDAITQLRTALGSAPAASAPPAPRATASASAHVTAAAPP